MPRKKKSKLRERIEKRAEEIISEVENNIRANLHRSIDLDKRHCSLLRDCKSFLSNLDENIVVLREPLLDISLEEDNIAIFDLIAVNIKTNIISLIECKGGTSTRVELKSFVEKILSFKKYQQQLEKILGFTFDKAEYIICVDTITHEALQQSIQAHINRVTGNKSSSVFGGLELDDIRKIIVWVVLERETRIIKTFGHHLDEEFEKIMSDPPQFESICNLDLEYSSHPWRYIEKIIYEKIYVTKYRYGDLNPKEFTRSEVVDKLVEEFEDLAIDDEKRRVIAERKADEIITHGLEYEIFEEISQDRYRILCRGERMDTVKDNLERKYIENYVTKNSKEKSLKRAEEMIKEEIAKQYKDLSEYGVSYDD